MPVSRARVRLCLLDFLKDGPSPRYSVADFKGFSEFCLGIHEAYYDGTVVNDGLIYLTDYRLSAIFFVGN